MKDLVAINHHDDDTFIVTWDLGRRCNFDCTYCPSHRHNLTSPHASLETLIRTSDFIVDYVKLHRDHHKNKKRASISITGGEPTTNPNFLELCKHLRATTNPKDFRISVTSNGAFSKKLLDGMDGVVNSMTISYHCESHPKIKQRVVENIYELKRRGNTWFKVNVMFHARYFDECRELCERFERDGIIYIPRVIGDNKDAIDKTSHTYTDEQLKWFADYWNAKNGKIDEKADKISSKVQENKASLMGRMCCGGRTVCGLTEGNDPSGEWTKFKFAASTAFKGWHCFINWFWLHIDQETGEIFHHQTCKANWEGGVGPIGHIDRVDQLLNETRERIQSERMPVIRCPNNNCGCGMCIAKARDPEVARTVFESRVGGIDLEL